MEQPISLSETGQIKVVLNQRQEKLVNKLEKKDDVKIIPSPKHELFYEMERELDNLIGMISIKEIMKEIYAWIYVNKERETVGLRNERQVLHMLFKGNPGTGKTTIARVIGKLLFKMEILSKGHLIEVERADLVGEYIGHTAQKTRDLVKKASGGILFIDEAYSLGRGGEKDFGKEAIDTLVKHMEDKAKDFILILAGYSNEMEQFLLLNPGLRSRFPFIIDFPDYTVSELIEISKKMFDEKEYLISEEALLQLQDTIRLEKNNNLFKFSNGRFIRNIVEKSIRKQAIRLLSENTFNREALLTITIDDL